VILEWYNHEKVFWEHPVEKSLYGSHIFPTVAILAVSANVSHEDAVILNKNAHHDLLFSPLLINLSITC
jgi:hypothetical protein